MMKRIFALLLCAATLLTTLSFVGCSSKDEEEGEEDKGQYITTYLTDNIYDLDPAHAYKNDAVANVVGMMFETLFKLDENGNVKKSLVDDYVIEENEKANEYKMKIYLKETKWSDGTDVSSSDVAFAWERLLATDADFEAAALLFDIKNARAAKMGNASIDDVGIHPAEQRMLEVQFEGKIDYDQFLLNLTSLALAPLRSDIVSKSDDWAKKAGTMVCSGPYKLGRINFKTTDEKYVDMTYIKVDENGNPVRPAPTDIKDFTFSEQVVTDFVLERNTYYHRDFNKDKLDKSVKPYKICVDCSLTDEQMIEMYEAGIITYIGDIPLSIRTGDNAIATNAVVAERSMSTSSLYFNQTAMVDNGTEEGEALFANAAVRQALSLAIDRQAIVDAIVYAEAATGLIPTGVFEAGNRKTTFRNACTTAYDYLKTDVAAASSLLTEAGITPSKYSFELICAAYDDVQVAIAEKIVEAWSGLGFHVTLKKLGTIANNDWYKYTLSIPTDICDDLYAEALRSGDFEVILLDSVAYSADPISMLAPYATEFSGRAISTEVEPDENGDKPLMSDEAPPTPHITGYNSEAYNAIMEKVFAEKNIANRAALYREAEAQLMTDLPVVPVVFNLNASVISSDIWFENYNYNNGIDFKKCSVRSYDDYLAAGKDYVTANFSEMKFTEAKDCTYTDFEVFKTASTIYMQFFPEDDAE